MRIALLSITSVAAAAAAYVMLSVSEAQARAQVSRDACLEYVNLLISQPSSLEINNERTNIGGGNVFVEIDFTHEGGRGPIRETMLCTYSVDPDYGWQTLESLTMDNETHSVDDFGIAADRPDRLDISWSVDDPGITDWIRAALP